MGVEPYIHVYRCVHTYVCVMCVCSACVIVCVCACVFCMYMYIRIYMSTYSVCACVYGVTMGYCGHRGDVSSAIQEEASGGVG